MRKKLLPICILAIISATIFTGCGSKEDVTDVVADNAIVEATEEPTVEPTVEPTTEPEIEEIEEEVEETTEPTTAPTEKPVATTKPTEKPVATPKPTEKPAHTHSYTLTASTAGSTCQLLGVDTYACSCGDSYTQPNGNRGSHTWTTETSTEIIHHPEELGYIDGFACHCGKFWPADGDLTHLSVDGCGYVTTGQTYVISAAWDETVTHTNTRCTTCGIQQ